MHSNCICLPIYCIVLINFLIVTVFIRTFCEAKNFNSQVFVLQDKEYQVQIIGVNGKVIYFSFVSSKLNHNYISICHFFVSLEGFVNCDALICPPTAEFCSVQIKSVNESLDWIQKEKFCLDEEFNVIETQQNIAPSPQPGFYVEKEFSNFSRKK